jgi:hypothetical protein
MDPTVERPGSRVASGTDLIACQRLLEAKAGVRIVVRRPGPDFRPHPHPTRAGQWIALSARVVPLAGDLDKIDQKQNLIAIHTAPELTGPWTVEQEIPFPEVVADQNLPEEKRDGVFCATLAEHPQFRTPGWLVASYSCRLGLAPTKLDPDQFTLKTLTIRYG